MLREVAVVLRKGKSCLASFVLHGILKDDVHVLLSHSGVWAQRSVPAHWCAGPKALPGLPGALQRATGKASAAEALLIPPAHGRARAKHAVSDPRAVMASARETVVTHSSVLQEMNSFQSAKLPALQPLDFPPFMYGMPPCCQDFVFDVSFCVITQSLSYSYRCWSTRGRDA